MHADEAGGFLQRRLQQADGKARGIRSDDGAGGNDGFKFAKELLFEFQILGYGLDDERAGREVVEAIADFVQAVPH